MCIGLSTSTFKRRPQSFSFLAFHIEFEGSGFQGTSMFGMWLMIEFSALTARGQFIAKSYGRHRIETVVHDTHITASLMQRLAHRCGAATPLNPSLCSSRNSVCLFPMQRWAMSHGCKLKIGPSPIAHAACLNELGTRESAWFRGAGKEGNFTAPTP